MSTPRLEINLGKIASNAKALSNLYGSKNISICGVTKVVCGNVMIAQTLVAAGLSMIGDSKVANLKKLQEGGINSTFLLIGTPRISQAAAIIKWADISNNSELVVIRELARHARMKGVTHQIILMVEMGDLREGIMPSSLEHVVAEVIGIDGIELVGLGTNLACLNGILPDQQKMDLLSTIAGNIEQKFHLSLKYISGGNSANYGWFHATDDPGRINHLRIGESLFLGVDPANRQPIPNLFRDIFTLITEVTEIKIKPSVPLGEKGQNTFGQILTSAERGETFRAILAIGRQDVDVSGLTPNLDIEILGTGSDHMVIDPKENTLAVGDEVSFGLNYAALLSAMTSPYVEKTTAPFYELQGIL